LLKEDRNVVEFEYEGDDEDKQVIEFNPNHGKPDFAQNRISGYIKKLLEITDKLEVAKMVKPSFLQ
jgi:hypothetical protein